MSLKAAFLKKKWPLAGTQFFTRILFFCLFLTGWIWLFLAITTPKLPSASAPIIFYSNQTRQDIKLLFNTAIAQAQKSIDVCVYGITDTAIVDNLRKKALEGVKISVLYDKKASSSTLLKQLPSTVQLCPSLSKGLMHRKILVLDQSTIFLGSANLTNASLCHHDNLVIGLHHPDLATFLEKRTDSNFSFQIDTCRAELWLLPDREQKALFKLINNLNAAQEKIQIAMFTLTHPRLADALIAAKQRGVCVEIAIDYYTARGASQKCLKRLKEAGICILISRGQELLHHKWAFIDEKELIMGSANWTQAAFQKNEDFLLFLTHLDNQKIKFLKKLWKNISTESFVMNDPFWY